MPTKPAYSSIAADVRARHGFVPQPCWIAHVLTIMGYPVRRAHNRQGHGEERAKPCPPVRVDPIRRSIERLASRS
jgi:hypothetical protein